MKFFEDEYRKNGVS